MKLSLRLEIVLKSLLDAYGVPGVKLAQYLAFTNEFKSFAGLKSVFNAVDKVGSLYVFDIGGNKLRLIAAIHFNCQKLFIRGILTHKEYDKGNWRKLT